MSSKWDGLVNDLNKTEIPEYAINKSLPSDSYFTSDKTARRCFKIFNNTLSKEYIDIEDYIFIEPSAGSGVFYNLMSSDKRIGVELYNENKEFIKADYLTWKPEDLKNKYVVLGNPPFGVRGAYALAFINRSLLWADYVGFILPMSFHSNGKGTNMKRVKNGHLIYSQILEQESFFSSDINKEITINSLFQVWKKGNGKGIFSDYDVSDYVDIYRVCASPDSFCGLKNIGLYDFYLSSSFYGDSLKIVYDFEDVKYKSGYGVIIKKSKDVILSKLKNIEWNEYGSLATNSVKHIRIHHIEKCLFDLGFGVEKETPTIKKANLEPWLPYK